MYDSVLVAISSSRTSLSTSCKLRLDEYHLVQKPFYKIIFNERNNKVLAKIKKWIISWFTYIENESEYTHSRNLFDDYLKSNAEIIGQHNVEHLMTMLISITRNNEHCFHYFFRNNTTLNFISDSIIEGQNGILRKHINANCTLERSAETQLLLTKGQAERKTM